MPKISSHLPKKRANTPQSSPHNPPKRDSVWTFAEDKFVQICVEKCTGSAFVGFCFSKTIHMGGCNSNENKVDCQCLVATSKLLATW